MWPFLSPLSSPSRQWSSICSRFPPCVSVRGFWPTWHLPDLEKRGKKEKESAASYLSPPTVSAEPFRPLCIVSLIYSGALNPPTTIDSTANYSREVVEVLQKGLYGSKRGGGGVCWAWGFKGKHATIQLLFYFFCCWWLNIRFATLLLLDAHAGRVCNTDMRLICWKCCRCFGGGFMLLSFSKQQCGSWEMYFCYDASETESLHTWWHAKDSWGLTTAAPEVMCSQLDWTQ